jgi:DNA-binding transcriptional LysR family regulator
MSRIQSRQIEAFRAVMVVGSMTQAGEILRISQSAVSRLVADLESEIGFRLFERRRAGLVPTEDGRRLYEEVDKSFIGLDRVEQAARSIRQLQNGHLRIVAMPVFANGILPLIIAKFTKSFPGVTISVEGHPRGRVIDYMLSQQCDIGIGTLPAGDKGIRVRSLSTRNALCVMPAASDLADQKSVSASQLRERPFISFSRDSLFRYQLDLYFERHGVNRKLGIDVSTSEAACNLVAAGAGLAIVTPFCPHLELDSRLAFRPLRPAIPVELGLLLPDLRPISTAATQFGDAVGRYFKEIDMLRLEDLESPAQIRARASR